MIYYLSYDVLKIDSYCLMEKKQFDQYPYFSKFGVLPVVREDARFSIEVINKSAEFLNSTGKAIWIFPQGEIIPNGRRPFHFYSGVSFLLEKLNNPMLLFCFMDFRMGANQFPEAYIEFFTSANALKEGNRKETARGISELFGKKAEDFDADYNAGNLTDFRELLKGRSSVSESKLIKMN